jgi:hypothetical protein
MLIFIPAIYKEGKLIMLGVPKNIKNSKAIVTFLDQQDDLDTAQIMVLSSDSFNEWDNEEDAIYDNCIS